VSVTVLSPEQVVERLRAACGERVLDVRLTEWAEGATRRVSRQIWIRLERQALRAAVRALMDIQFPHFAVISGVDVGEEVELLYHLYLFWGVRHSELLVTFTVGLPKSDPKVDTITDLIPGALISEREKQEMLGVEVVGIPDSRRMFLPNDFPEGVYPWRKDDTGIPESMVRKLWQTGRPQTEAAAQPGETETD
jgi:membrane-bound hydrogenase subunit beta